MNTNSLQHEVKQGMPFGSLEQEAYLSILRTAAVLEHGLSEVFREHGITATQYNVLRILHGSVESGMCRNEVSERLVARVPDATRLIDRLEAMGLVTRSRDGSDRRTVTTRITPKGVELLERLYDPVARAHREQLGHLTREELSTIIELTARARTRA